MVKPLMVSVGIMVLQQFSGINVVNFYRCGIELEKVIDEGVGALDSATFDKTNFIHDKKLTPILAASLQAGLLLVYVLAGFKVVGWRQLAFVGAVPPLILLLGAMSVMPESPRWLCSSEPQKQPQALRALRKLRGRADVDVELLSFQDAMFTAHEGEGSMTISAPNSRDNSRAAEAALQESQGSNVPVILYTLLATFGSVSFGYAVGFSLPSEEKMTDGDAHFQLTTPQFKTFSLLLTIGATVGCLLGGLLADIIGRQKTLLFFTLPYIGGSVAMAFTECYWLLLLGRMMTGLSVGVMSFTVPVYIAEIAPTRFSS
eukprot:gene13553-16022_t